MYTTLIKLLKNEWALKNGSSDCQFKRISKTNYFLGLISWNFVYGVFFGVFCGVLFLEVLLT